MEYSSIPKCFICTSQIKESGYYCCNPANAICKLCEQMYSCWRCGQNYTKIIYYTYIIKNRVDVCCLCQKKVTKENSYLETNCNIRYCLPCMVKNYNDLQGSSLFKQNEITIVLLKCRCQILIQEEIQFLKQFCCFCLNRINGEEYVTLADGRRIDIDCMRPIEGKYDEREKQRNKFNKMVKKCIHCNYMIGKSKRYCVRQPYQLNPVLHICNLCGLKPMDQPNRQIEIVPSVNSQQELPLPKKDERQKVRIQQKSSLIINKHQQKCDLCDQQSTKFEIFDQNKLKTCQKCLRNQQRQIELNSLDRQNRNHRNVPKTICGFCNRPLPNPHEDTFTVDSKVCCITCKNEKDKKQEKYRKDFEKIQREMRNHRKQEVSPRRDEMGSIQQFQQIKPLSKIPERSSQPSFSSIRYQNLVNNQLRKQPFIFDLSVTIFQNKFMYCTRCLYQIPESSCLFLQSGRIFNPSPIVRVHSPEERIEGIKYDPYCQVCTILQKDDQIMRAQLWKENERIRQKQVSPYKKLVEMQQPNILITPPKAQMKVVHVPLSLDQSQPRVNVRFVSPQTKQIQKRPLSNKSPDSNNNLSIYFSPGKELNRQDFDLVPRYHLNRPQSKPKQGVQVLTNRSPQRKTSHPSSSNQLAQCFHCKRTLKAIPGCSLPICECKDSSATFIKCIICAKISTNPFCKQCKADSTSLQHAISQQKPFVCSKCHRGNQFYYSAKRKVIFCENCKYVQQSSP